MAAFTLLEKNNDSPYHDQNKGTNFEKFDPLWNGLFDQFAREGDSPSLFIHSMKKTTQTQFQCVFGVFSALNLVQVCINDRLYP